MTLPAAVAVALKFAIEPATGVKLMVAGVVPVAAALTFMLVIDPDVGVT